MKLMNCGRLLRPEHKHKHAPSPLSSCVVVGVSSKLDEKRSKRNYHIHICISLDAHSVYSKTRGRPNRAEIAVCIVHAVASPTVCQFE